MRMLLACTAVVAALASPAVAQTINHHPTRYPPGGPNTYIYPPDNHAHSSNTANDVYDTRGRYVGSDPDPFIRDSLARSPSRD
jgi:hypothetical protein